MLTSQILWQVVYFNRRVRDLVASLPTGILADYLRLIDLMTVHGADLQMPHSRAMGGGLFELRAKGKEGAGRVFYCMRVGKTIVILHSFIKKSARTPSKDINIARQRMKQAARHG